MVPLDAVLDHVALTTCNSLNRIDIEQQRRRAAFVRGFWVENVCFTETEVKRVNPTRMLSQQMAEVSCWRSRRCDR
jgi:hypothetical protein